MATTISVFNNKGGVGKTSIIWNLAVALADKDKNVLLIDFDPQCNLSIACIGDTDFVECLETSQDYPLGRTIKSFAWPYIQQSRIGKVYTREMKTKPEKGKLHIALGDFWLNSFSDLLNVGTDVISGSGLYRFIIPTLFTTEAQEENKIEYDYVLIDLPPSFNTIVRSALYCSNYFLVPCTPDLFSAYCVGLIGEMLPKFIQDWEQGTRRYLKESHSDYLITSQGSPKFGGWIFNGFDTRKNKKVGADEALFNRIRDSIKSKMIPVLKENIEAYEAIPEFSDENPVANIEDLNVVAPDSIYQNAPIKYLRHKRPTQLKKRNQWAPNQIELMDKTIQEFEKLAKHIIDYF